MHTSNRYTHKTGGAYMHTNGGDGRSGPIPHGGGTWERHGSVQRGPGYDICNGWQTPRKRKVKRRSTDQQEATQTKGKKRKQTSHHWCINYEEPKRKKSGAERGKNARKQPKQNEQQTRAKTTTRYYAWKKNTEQKKTQSKYRNSATLHM